MFGADFCDYLAAPAPVKRRADRKESIPYLNWYHMLLQQPPNQRHSTWASHTVTVNRYTKDPGPARRRTVPVRVARKNSEISSPITVWD
jgi:hypothetical protein